MTIMRRGVGRVAATVLSLTLTLGAGVVAAQDASATPVTVRDPIARADKALAKARTQLAANQPGQAVDALHDLKHQVWSANTKARAQIGKPPTDPESDDPPGPPAVFAVLSLEHRVVTTLVTLYDGEAHPAVVDSLQITLRDALRRRDALLDAVIALPEEGGLADYTDDMSDRLAMYTKEVTQVSSALSTYSLTPEASAGLTKALARVTATKKKVDKVFGGGE